MSPDPTVARSPDVKTTTKKTTRVHLYFCTGYKTCSGVDGNGRFKHKASNLRKCPHCGASVNHAGSFTR